MSDKAKTAREKDALAWAGMLQGFSDRLTAVSGDMGTTTDLSKVVAVVLHRLDAEYRAQLAAFDSMQAKPAHAKKAQ